MNQVLTVSAHDPILDEDTLNKIFRFRHKVFYENLGWDVGSDEGRERDNFDDLDPVYIFSRNHNKEIEGFWRLLPTTGSYMLKDTFSGLLCGSAAPQDPTVWELSRFSVMPHNSGEKSQAVMNLLALEMMRSVVEFAEQHGIRRYVTVTSVALERLFKRTGLTIYRLGSQTPIRIGNVLTVACYADMDSHARQAIFKSYDEAMATPIAA